MTLPQAQVLLADDDPNFRKVMLHNLDRLGLAVESFEDGKQALERFRQGGIDLVLTDVKMPVMDGLQLLAAIREVDAKTPVILITAHGDIEMAVEAMQAGASDFLTKPFERARLQQKIERALRMVVLERENRSLRAELTERFSFQNIIGSSAPMRELFGQMNRLAQLDTTVLVLGDSGSGKELVARALHYSGRRAKGSFVAVNCAAIPAELLESELFGHVRGAFTGADATREGRFQTASGGTLFLDEIGDMPPALQVKILRALQERTIEPVGSNRPVAVDVRIIAATHQDLDALVREGSFREDLYYRLNVVQLRIPPLRERPEDIPLLVRHFLQRFGMSELPVDREAMELLIAHGWPGNVRELENAIERALALRARPDRLAAEDLLLAPAAAKREAGQDVAMLPEEGVVLDDLEKRLIEQALERTGNNQSRSARLLGISRQKLIYRMQKHGL